MYSGILNRYTSDWLRSVVERQSGPPTGPARLSKSHARAVLRKNLCRDRIQLVVMMQAAETRAADDTMRGR